MQLEKTIEEKSVQEKKLQNQLTDAEVKIKLLNDDLERKERRIKSNTDKMCELMDKMQTERNGFELALSGKFHIRSFTLTA